VAYAADEPVCEVPDKGQGFASRRLVHYSVDIALLFAVTFVGSHQGIRSKVGFGKELVKLGDIGYMGSSNVTT